MAILAQNDLAATTDTLVYTVPTGKKAWVSINMVARSGSPTVRLALNDGTGSPPAAKEYIEYDFPLVTGRASLLREGIRLEAGSRIYARASAANVSVTVYGKVEDI